MQFSEQLLPHSQGTPIERLGLGVLLLESQVLRHLVQAGGDIDMLVPVQVGPHNEGCPSQRIRLDQPSLGGERQGETAQARGNIRMLLAVERSARGERLAKGDFSRFTGAGQDLYQA